MFNLTSLIGGLPKINFEGNAGYLDIYRAHGNWQLVSQKPCLLSDILRYQATHLIWLRYRAHLTEFVYDKYIIVPFWFSSAAYQSLVSSPYEPRFDQTSLIYRRSESKRYDLV